MSCVCADIDRASFRAPAGRSGDRSCRHRSAASGPEQRSGVVRRVERSAGPRLDG
jgi:hypothetical protein